MDGWIEFDIAAHIHASFNHFDAAIYLNPNGKQNVNETIANFYRVFLFAKILAIKKLNRKRAFDIFVFSFFVRKPSGRHQNKMFWKNSQCNYMLLVFFTFLLCTFYVDSIRAAYGIYPGSNDELPSYTGFFRFVYTKNTRKTKIIAVIILWTGNHRAVLFRHICFKCDHKTRMIIFTIKMLSEERKNTNKISAASSERERDGRENGRECWKSNFCVEIIVAKRKQKNKKMKKKTNTPADCDAAATKYRQMEVYSRHAPKTRQQFPRRDAKL